MVAGYVRTAWGAYKKNFFAILGAEILLFAIVFGIALLSILPFTILWTFTSNGTDSGSTLQASSILAIAYFAAVLIIATAAWISLFAGFIGVCHDALKKKAKIERMFSLAKEKFWTILGANALVGVIVMAAALALMVPTIAAFSTDARGLLMLLIWVVLINLFSLLFTLTNQGIVIGNLRAIDAVKASYRIVKARYLEFLALTLVFTGFSVVATLVPFLGLLIYFAAVMPVALLAYTAFYEKNAGKNKGL